jgi:hypothetical protein
MDVEKICATNEFEKSENQYNDENIEDSFVLIEPKKPYFSLEKNQANKIYNNNRH